MTTTEGGSRPAAVDPGASPVLARVAAAVCGATMTVFGLWALVGPASFAALIDFPPANEHLLHDLGAFQIGLGVGLLLSLVVSDALTTALAGFVVAGALHTLNHVVDLPLGGHRADPWGLGVLVLLAAVGLTAQLRRASARPRPRTPER